MSVSRGDVWAQANCWDVAFKDALYYYLAGGLLTPREQGQVDRQGYLFVRVEKKSNKIVAM